MLQADERAELLLISNSSVTSSALQQRLQPILGEWSSRLQPVPKMPVERCLSLSICADVARQCHLGSVSAEGVP